MERKPYILRLVLGAALLTGVQALAVENAPGKTGCPCMNNRKEKRPQAGTGSGTSMSPAKAAGAGAAVGGKPKASGNP